jgi:copper chaperone CopZ
MTCPSCANSIGYALKSIDPKAQVTVDLKTQTVRVSSDKPQADITALIEEAGYPVLKAQKVS